MTKEGWRAVIVEAFKRALECDMSVLDGLAIQLAEEDHAKQLLHDAGFGVTGTCLLSSVQEAIAWIAGAHNPADGT